jgi:hypothetical protein
MSTQPIPLADQSVFRKQGVEESYRARQGDKVMEIFNGSHKFARGGVQREDGIGLPWWARSSTRKSLMLTSNQGQGSKYCRR